MKGVKFQLPQTNKGTPQGDAKSEIEFVLELENMINKPVDWERDTITSPYFITNLQYQINWQVLLTHNLWQKIFRNIIQITWWHSSSECKSKPNTVAKEHLARNAYKERSDTTIKQKRKIQNIQQIQPL